MSPVELGVYILKDTKHAKCSIQSDYQSIDFQIQPEFRPRSNIISPARAPRRRTGDETAIDRTLKSDLETEGKLLLIDFIIDLLIDYVI